MSSAGLPGELQRGVDQWVRLRADWPAGLHWPRRPRLHHRQDGRAHHGERAEAQCRWHRCHCTRSGANEIRLQGQVSVKWVGFEGHNRLYIKDERRSIPRLLFQNNKMATVHTLSFTIQTEGVLVAIFYLQSVVVAMSHHNSPLTGTAPDRDQRFPAVCDLSVLPPKDVLCVYKMLMTDSSD